MADFYSLTPQFHIHIKKLLIRYFYKYITSIYSSHYAL